MPRKNREELTVREALYDTIKETLFDHVTTANTILPITSNAYTVSQFDRKSVFLEIQKTQGQTATTDVIVEGSADGETWMIVNDARLGQTNTTATIIYVPEHIPLIRARILTLDSSGSATVTAILTGRGI